MSSLTSDRTYLVVGFDQAIKGREDQYPLLARALNNRGVAISSKIEWLVEDADGERHCVANYTQIVRFPYAGISQRQETRAEQLTKMLDAVEQILWHGTPSVDYGSRSRSPRSTCGGVLHYLGREPRDDDEIRLRVLRDLCWIEIEDGGEWLAEFSLQVRSTSV